MSKFIERTGNISIHTENILPIIKKWLYSDHEIFLRELISNGYDAINKLNKLSLQESIDGISEPKINLVIDSKAKTLTFSDTGLGLDHEEVEKYIAQVAFSSAEEFVEKFKGQNDEADKNEIIGHFGLGFYSAFMVADLVEIKSKSYKKEAPSVFWSCDGSTEYSIKESDRKEIGTDIILHIGDDYKQFLDESTVKSLVVKYANYLPVEIQVNGEKVNDEQPLWVKAPTDTTEEEYKEFYSKLFPMNAEPLFWIHLNVDFPFNLKGILYFPKIMHELDSNKGHVKLFCKQVFVSDNANDVIPEFLTLLQGAIDCPDIPLNVSRSYLQNDPYVQKISKHIVKKVADKLNQLYKKDLDRFKSIWTDVSPFIKYGMMQSDEFYKKVKDIVVFESSSDELTSMPDYLERNKEKLEKKVLYCSDRDAQATYVSLCQEQSLEVLFLQSMIDSHFLQFLESKDTEIKYVSVDSELSDVLVDSNASSEDQKESDKKVDDQLVELFKEVISEESLKYEVKPLKTDSVPGMVLESEYVKRMKTMNHFMKGNQMPVFDDCTLVINSNNELVKSILKLKADSNQKELVSDLCHHIYDLAKMSQQQLSGEKMQGFLKRSTQLMTQLSQVLVK